jgi:hypothetical protein
LCHIPEDHNLKHIHAHTHTHVHTHTQTRAHAHSFESHKEALDSMFHTFNLYAVHQGLVVLKKRGHKSKIFP